MPKRLFLHDSTEKGAGSVTGTGKFSRSKNNVYARSVNISGKQLNLSNAIAAGDYVMQVLKRREEFRAQHGPVRVLWKDGKPVDQSDK